MGSTQGTDGLCKLERKLGWQAKKRFMFCQGLHSSIKIFHEGNSSQITMEPYGECTECRRYLYRKCYVNCAQIVVICACLLLILVLGTPEGAIRRNLFVQEGIQEAVSGRIEKVTDEKGGTKKNHYNVTVNGEQQEWEVICLQYSCFARRQEE